MRICGRQSHIQICAAPRACSQTVNVGAASLARVQ
jgi:hypothetical protein